MTNELSHTRLGRSCSRVADPRWGPSKGSCGPSVHLENGQSMPLAYANRLSGLHGTTEQVGELAAALAAVPGLRLAGDNYRLWRIVGENLDDPGKIDLSPGTSPAVEVYPWAADLELIPLEEEAQPLAELSVRPGSRILLELRNKDLTWPEEIARLAKGLGSGDAAALRAPNAQGAPCGVTGLYNLGCLAALSFVRIGMGVGVEGTRAT